MDKRDYGKSAICGVCGQDVIVSRYNCKCPCLNCVSCNDEKQKQQCGWRGVLEMNPCSNEEMRLIMCVNCKKAEQRN